MYGVATFVRGRWRGRCPRGTSKGALSSFASAALRSSISMRSTARRSPTSTRAGRVAGDRHELKRRFQSSLMDLGGATRGEGGVIMAGDWNVSRSALDTHPRLRTEEPHARARAELNARLTRGGFVDIWRERHPNERAIRGSTGGRVGSMPHASTTSSCRWILGRACARPRSSSGCRGATMHR